MTIQFQGMRRHETDISDDYGLAHYVQNAAFRREGELTRRPGMGKSSMASLGAPIYTMCGGWFDEPYLITFGPNSATGIPEITSTRDPVLLWTDIGMVPPPVVIATPVAPVITGVLPLSGTYVVGLVTFTPTITYDNLSGPLIYSWSILGGPSSPVPSTSANSTWDATFDGSCIPGSYFLNLGVSTTLNGFTASFPFTFTIT